jgi:16S rRNA (guanine966-N2)-methyltransferase
LELGSDQQLSGCAVLDLFAGSGAIGFEAISRGATACWVEQDRRALRVIKQNMAQLGAGGYLVAGDVFAFLAASNHHSFDIIWADPPYGLATDRINDLIQLVIEHDWLRPGGQLLIERDKRSGGLEFPEAYVSCGQRSYGDTVVFQATRG